VTDVKAIFKLVRLEFNKAMVGGPLGLSPPLFYSGGKLNIRGAKHSEEREEKTDGPRTDDITIFASTNKMKLVRFYSSAIRLQLQNI
jgi:hypothetical protein